MTRALLLDTSFAARPIHDWLLEEGFEVWTIGNRPQDVLARRDAGTICKTTMQMLSSCNLMSIDWT
jgi:hypothetical protein